MTDFGTIKEQLERLDHLDLPEALKELQRLMEAKQYDLLVAWLFEGKYFDIPAEAMRNCTDAALAAKVLVGLDSRESKTRTRAACALGPLGGPAAGAKLCQILEEKADGEELGKVASALERLRFEGARECLRKTLDKLSRVKVDEITAVCRVEVARALYRSGDDRGFEALVDGLFQEDWCSNEYAGGLAKLDDPRAVEPMKTVLPKTRNRNTRTIAENVLAQWDQPLGTGSPCGLCGEVIRSSVVRSGLAFICGSCASKLPTEKPRIETRDPAKAAESALYSAKGAAALPDTNPFGPFLGPANSWGVKHAFRGSLESARDVLARNLTRESQKGNFRCIEVVGDEDRVRVRVPFGRDEVEFIVLMQAWRSGNQYYVHGNLDFAGPEDMACAPG